jgi:hypothetical protein
MRPYRTIAFTPAFEKDAFSFSQPFQKARQAISGLVARARQPALTQEMRAAFPARLPTQPLHPPAQIPPTAQYPAELTKTLPVPHLQPTPGGTSQIFTPMSAAEVAAHTPTFGESALKQHQAAIAQPVGRGRGALEMPAVPEAFMSGMKLPRASQRGAAGLGDVMLQDPRMQKLVTQDPKIKKFMATASPSERDAFAHMLMQQHGGDINMYTARKAMANPYTSGLSQYLKTGAQYQFTKVSNAAPGLTAKYLAGKHIHDFYQRGSTALGALQGARTGGVAGSVGGAVIGGIRGAATAKPEESRFGAAARGAGKGALIGGTVGAVGGGVIGGRGAYQRAGEVLKQKADLIGRANFGFGDPNAAMELLNLHRNNPGLRAYSARNQLNQGNLSVADALREFSQPKVGSEGGAWQRSEGKNPEGGLNAKGRASLRAQGHDIKPGVKGPANTPEKMKRKGSFLSRMFGPGAPGSMKKDNGEPSRRALSAKAWGEPVPQDDAGRARLYAKGQALLKRYENKKEASIEDAAIDATLAHFGLL